MAGEWNSAISLFGIVNVAGVQQRPGEFVGFLPLVHAAQAVPDGLAAQPVTAAFVAQEVAPAAGPRLVAVPVRAPGRRAGARDDCDAGAGAAGREQEAGVVDHGDPGPRGVRLDEGGQGGGVLSRCRSRRRRRRRGHGTPADFGEKFRQVRRGFLAADVLDVGASHALVGHRFPVLEADAPRLGAADVEADHDVVGWGPWTEQLGETASDGTALDGTGGASDRLSELVT